jgi:hypothetical protein
MASEMAFPDGIGGSPNAIARLLVAYDRVRAACDGTPTREAMGIEQLRGLIGWEFFAEWVAPASIAVRLSGAHIDYMLGTNVTGVNFFDKYRPEQRALYSALYGAIADTPCGGYTVRRVVVGGAEAYRYHSIYLPLAPKPDAVPIVGAVAITGFERIAPSAEDKPAPDFQALEQLGVFDIGHGVPAGPPDAVDIGAIIAGIDAAGAITLDQQAHATRSPIGRPPRLR